MRLTSTLERRVLLLIDFQQLLMEIPDAKTRLKAVTALVVGARGSHAHMHVCGGARAYCHVRYRGTAMIPTAAQLLCLLLQLVYSYLRRARCPRVFLCRVHCPMSHPTSCQTVGRVLTPPLSWHDTCNSRTHHRTLLCWE